MVQSLSVLLLYCLLALYDFSDFLCDLGQILFASLLPPIKWAYFTELLQRSCEITESKPVPKWKIFSDRKHPNHQRAHLNTTWDGHKKMTHSEAAQFQLRGLFGRIEQPGLKIFISQSSNWSKHKWLCSAYTWDYCADPKSWCCVYEKPTRSGDGLVLVLPKHVFPFSFSGKGLVRVVVIWYPVWNQRGRHLASYRVKWKKN